MVDTNKDTQAVQTQADDEEVFTREEEISETFDICQKAWMQYEDCEVKIPYEDTIRMLKKVEKSIIAHGIFSPNETLKELQTEYIK